MCALDGVSHRIAQRLNLFMSNSACFSQAYMNVEMSQKSRPKETGA
jgi:hypothetical protein